VPLVVTRPVIPEGTTTDQVMLAPTVVDVILTKLIELPEQITSFSLENVMFGVGFIFMVNVFETNVSMAKGFVGSTDFLIFGNLIKKKMSTTLLIPPIP
jgi:hypothetical protein